MKIKVEQASSVCRELLGADVTSVSRLGGSSRNVWRVNLAGDSSVIAAHRNQPNRALLEQNILHRLHGYEGCLPHLLCVQGPWIIQSDLGTDRLSKCMAQGEKAGDKVLLIEALESLHKIQSIGAKLKLRDHVSPIGRRSGWNKNLLLAPNRLARLGGFDDPAYDMQTADDIISRCRSMFIKWDARPGNAILKADGKVAWFDFEHCGLRDPLDDLAWFLGDEYVPDHSEVEQELIDGFVEKFAGDLGEKSARTYLSVFGTLHMCIRLELILRRKKDGPWWSYQSCLNKDTVGATRLQFLELTKKATRWAAQHPSTSPLSPWLIEFGETMVAREPITQRVSIKITPQKAA